MRSLKSAYGKLNTFLNISKSGYRLGLKRRYPFYRKTFVCNWNNNDTHTAITMGNFFNGLVLRSPLAWGSWKREPERVCCLGA
jgi:hypothetical protein